MNMQTEEWILTIAEEKNITRAAEKLYVSPSALTQTINKIEHQLGTKLFIRSKKGCFLTEAGKVYVEGIHKMLRLRRETYARIHDVAQFKNATLSIGFPPEHGSHVISNLYPILQDNFPSIHITIHEASVRKQQALIANGDLDIGFLTLIDSQKTKDEYIPICKEELLIVLPTGSAPTKYSREEEGSRFPILDLHYLRDFPIARLYSESTIHSWTNSLYKEAGFEPHVIIETTRQSTLLHMVGTGLCGGLITDYYCPSILRNKSISVFCLPSHPYWWFMASYRRDSYLSKPMKMLISLANEYWAQK